MSAKFFRLNDDIYIFHPDTHDVLRVEAQCLEQLDQPEAIRALRLKAIEITRRQAEQAIPCLYRLVCQNSVG